MKTGKHMLGRKWTKTMRDKMNKPNKGWFRKGHKDFVGITRKHHSEETKKKIGEKSKGRKSGMLGKHHSEETKRKISVKNKGRNVGENHYNWKNGITPLMEQIRKCWKYRQWRSDIFHRDNYMCLKTCIKCKILCAHHIKSFNQIIKENKITTLQEALDCEELWDIDNGITLCKEVHEEFHKKYGDINTQKQLEEFLNN